MGRDYWTGLGSLEILENSSKIIKLLQTMEELIARLLHSSVGLGNTCQSKPSSSPHVVKLFMALLEA